MRIRRVLEKTVAPIFESRDRIVAGGGQPDEEHTQPVGEEFVATRPGAEEIERGFLDPIFGFAPQTVEIVVESVGKQFEMADDEAGVLS